MVRSLANYKRLIVLVLFTTLIIFLLSPELQHRPLLIVERPAGYLLLFFQRGLGAAVQGIGHSWSSYIALSGLRDENQRLQRYQQEVRRLHEMMLVNPRWPGRSLEVEQDLCFLLMTFREPWSDDGWELIRNVVASCGMRCRRADEQEGRVVMDDIWDGVRKARVIVADLTGKNPNVTYEVGLADVLGKDVVLLSQTPQDVPFDFQGIRLITYEN